MLLALLARSPQAEPPLCSGTRSNSEKYARTVVDSGGVLDLCAIDNRSGMVLPPGGFASSSVMTSRVTSIKMNGDL
jgi:hypothetical protein